MNVLLRNGLAISPKLLHRDPCRSFSSLLTLSSRPTTFLTLTCRHFPLAFVRHPQPNSAAPSESVLSFVSNKVWNATHRSRIPRSHERPSPFNQPPRHGFWQRLRERLDSVPTEVVLYGILVLNGLVFGAWQLAWSNWQVMHDSSTMIWMRQNFTVNMLNMNAGRIWTVLTACFSHENISHLFFNAFTYYFMAPSVLGVLGNANFLALYLGGGLACSLASLWWHNSVKHNPAYASHGASGAVYAVVSFLGCLVPHAKFLIFGIVPLPAWAFVTGIFLYDGYNSLYQTGGMTDSAGHIGGILAGMAFYAGKRFRIF